MDGVARPKRSVPRRLDVELPEELSHVMGRDLLAADIGPKRLVEGNKRRPQLCGRQEVASTRLEDGAAVMKEPESVRIVGCDSAAMDRAGRLARGAGPVVTLSVGDREERLPAVLGAVVELGRKRLVRQRQVLDT